MTYDAFNKLLDDAAHLVLALALSRAGKPLSLLTIDEQN